MEVIVEFSWREAGGILRKGKGRSRDVSDVGAFVLASACPPVGAVVNYKLYLSGDPGTKLARVEERVAKVVRVERPEEVRGVGRSGFAVFGESRR